MERVLEVKYGTIYTSGGIGIDHIGVIIDKNSGLLKYGDTTKNLKDYFIEMVSKYRKVGLSDIADDLVYIEFDRYDGILSIEEICTFVNYMVMCSANGERIMKMLNMDEENLKIEIKKLAEIGY